LFVGVLPATVNWGFDSFNIWEYPKINREEFLAGVIRVDVYDANTIMRNEIIGRYELDIR